jgi:hypothetical protein
MSQNDFTIANQTFPNTRADINLALQALASTSSGTSAPSTTFANQFWYDTSANTLYIRNEDNDANITLAVLDQSNDTVEYFKSDSIRTALIEFTDGDDALTIADGGALTTAGNLSIGGSNNELRFYEGANYVGFEAPALSGDKIWVLPTADGSANQGIVTNGSGTLSFADVGGDSLRPNVKPLIINGDMAVAQRGTSTSGITASSLITCDRMNQILADNGTWTQSQSTTTPTGQGFAKSWKIDCTTADTSVAAASKNFLSYKFEGQDVQLFKKGTSNAEKLTLSYWIRTTVTGTYVAELYDTDNTRSISQTYTVTDSNTWQKIVLSFVADTSGTLTNDINESFVVNIWFGAGSNFTSGTLNTSWGTATNTNRAVGQVNGASSTSNEIYVTGLQLEVGEYTASTLPSFQHEMYDDTLLRCHRYYIHGTGDTGLNPTAEAATATTVQPTPQLRRTMRVAPTLTANPVSFIALIGGSGNTTTLAFSNMGRNGFRYGLNHDASISTQQNVAMGGLGADFDAEL